MALKQWKLPSLGAEADPNDDLQARCDRILYDSRVTYVEANLMRQLKKTEPGPLESNAVFEYLSKYDEVSRDDVHPWLRARVVELFKQHPPEAKNVQIGKIDKVKSVPWLNKV